MSEEIPVHVDPSLSMTDVIQWLPIITQMILTYPALKAAHAGDVVSSPTVPDVRLAGGKFDVEVRFTKK